MIWRPQSCERFLQVFPQAEQVPRVPFANGDEPIAARCGDYSVLADGHGLVAMPEGTKSYARSPYWTLPKQLASADEARDVIGRAPLNKKWFLARGWLRETLDA